LPRRVLESFKRAPNSHCGNCLAKGWSGFMHSSKVDHRAPAEVAAELAPSSAS
jgi:hypothetical protein